MEFFKPGRQFDFMRQRLFWVPLSITLVVISTVITMWKPGPNYGTDFRGGTEVELSFLKPITRAGVVDAVTAIGFKDPDVLQVDPSNKADPYHFLIRVQDVSAITEETKGAVRGALCYVGEGAVVNEDKCPQALRATEIKFSPGGDKIEVRYDNEPGDDAKAVIKAEVESVPGVKLRTGENNPQIVNHRLEIQLQSKGDQLFENLRNELATETGCQKFLQGCSWPAGVPPSPSAEVRAAQKLDAVPDHASRVEWVGPKAGKQLRDSARNAVAIAIVFIMLYLAFRFDLRFAPGVIVACIHDAMVVIGFFVVFQKEITLSTIAAVLTIVGYSMNDTVVVYDRIRENLSKHRGKSFWDVINISVSETLSRTILTSGATMLSVLAFFIWGTGVIKDFALAMVVGIVAGTYSSIYVAAPFTEWIDVQMSKRERAKRKRVTLGAAKPSTS